jgi:putative nucleotidyltransferase-like protein
MSIWDEADRLIDRTESLERLRAHKLHLLAARRWRSLGRTIPPALVDDERVATMMALTVPALLTKIRAACDGPLVVIKGPEIASRYPEPNLRTFIDLDALVPNVDAVQAQLVTAGFQETDDPPWASPKTNRRADPFANMHHARPLRWPELPLRLELHRWPSWPRWLTPPPVDELFSASVPSSLPVDGIQTLRRQEHTLLVAAHGWVHEPLGRIRDLLDVAAMAEGLDRDELDAIAERWGIRRLWRSTVAVADALLDPHARATMAQTVWARNLAAVRERTVIESHLEGWVSCLWSAPPRRALPLAFSNMLWDLRPAAGESWGDKLSRSRKAVLAALSPKSDHDRRLGRGARRLSPVTRWRRPPGPGR